jgi:hypothetical protein
MSAKNVPSAWDDDWEKTADVRSLPVSFHGLKLRYTGISADRLKQAQESAPSEPERGPQILSRAERKAQHREANKKLWESA